MEKLTKMGSVSDPQSYEKYLEKKKYPELFQLAERDLGNDRDALVKLIKPLLTPKTRNQGVLYELISKWPFACYLTTNYDDELETHLARKKEHFMVVRNRKEDFYNWRDGASHLIQKLHSDLNHPDELVLTSDDYRRVYVGDSDHYYRERLCDVFTMFDIFIIGHSLTDPDIDYVLQLAREVRSPDHPIFMIAADFTSAEEQELFEKYNIVLVRYSNPDDTHSELKRMLKTVDRFIAPRHLVSQKSTITSRPEEEVESAIAIFLYRRLQGGQPTDYLSPLVLSVMYSANNEELTSENIVSLPVLKNIIKGG